MTHRPIDLHCHSTASDGHLTPAQLVQRARERNLGALALTDHDTLAGLGMFHDAGKQYGVETLSGVEVSAEFAQGTMHILGLFVDPQHQAFRAFLKQLSDGRKIRNPRIIGRLNELGMAITMEEVEAEAGISAQRPGVGAIDKSIGRPHIAAVLIRKGYARHKQDAFDKYLAKGASAYFPRFAASPRDSIEHIRSAGGMAILAHPTYLKAGNDAELERIVRELKDIGLDGIEVWYGTHTLRQTEQCLALAKKLDLLPSGGSDFHGEAARGGNADLGQGIHGALNIPYSVLEAMRERRAARR